MRPRRWLLSNQKSNQRRPLPKQRLPLRQCKPLRLLKRAFSVGSKACLAVPKHPPNLRQQLLLAMSRKTTAKVMPNARRRVIAGANAVAVMAAEVAVVAANAVTARRAAQMAEVMAALMGEVMDEVMDEVRAEMKAAQKAEAMSAANAAQSSEVTSLVLISVVSNATNNAASSALNSDLKAKSSASRAHRARHARRVNQAVRALARSAHAVNGAIEVVNNALRWTPPSKTLRWPTKPRWLRQWAARP